MLEKKWLLESNDNNIFPTHYAVKFYSIFKWEINLKDGVLWKIEPYYIWTQTLIGFLNNQLNNNKNKLIRLLDIDKFHRNELEVWDTLESAIENFINGVKEVVENTNSKWETLILWFSIFDDGIQLDTISKLIKEIKRKYKNVIFVWWGPSFTKWVSKEHLNYYFNKWIDIINIWWWKEFIEFISSLSENEYFYLDENNNVRFKWNRVIPWNIVFNSTENKNIESSWTEIEPEWYFDAVFNKFYFPMKDSDCLNVCHFCSIDLQWSKLTSLSIKNNSDKLNWYLEKIEKKWIWLSFRTPNPLQQLNKFIEIVKSINFSKVKTISLFWDFIGLQNDKNLSKLKELLYYFKNNYPNIKIGIAYWIDSLDYKNDWEFIGKWIWKITAQQKHYDRALSNLDELIIFAKEIWNFSISANLIFHPALDVDQFIKKLEYARNVENRKFVSGVTFHHLIPFHNTILERGNVWNYIPKIIADEILWTKFLEVSWEYPVWGHFYRNSRYLDLMYFFIKFGWEKWISKFEKILKNQSLITFLESKNRLFSYYVYIQTKFMINDLLELGKNTKLDDHEQYPKLVRTYFTMLKTSLVFILNRERYLMSINPSYSSLPWCSIFLKDISFLISLISNILTKFQSHTFGEIMDYMIWLWQEFENINYDVCNM